MMKTPYLTNPEGVFNKDLLETIDINELQNLVIQTRHRLEERISSQSPATAMFVQITHLAAEAEAANELSIKSHKFQEASNLAFKLAQEYQENNLNTVFELLNNYSYLLQVNKKFSMALYYLNLAKEAKTNNNKATQLFGIV
jgi:alpha-D-ribose 1-methylphosphonate 5-phosphate C-P lyase